MNLDPNTMTLEEALSQFATESGMQSRLGSLSEQAERIMSSLISTYRGVATATGRLVLEVDSRNQEDYLIISNSGTKYSTSSIREIRKKALKTAKIC